MKAHHRPTVFRAMIPCLGAVLALVSSVDASSRRFTYSYETTTMAKGAMELENWMTWKTNQADEPGLDSFQMRHEFEYGVTDRLQLAFYFADWSVEHSSGHSKTDFNDVAVEAIYNLTDPNTTAFGSAVYGEIKGSDDFIELEAKLLLQKNIGAWMIVYNIGGEIAWEDDYTEDEAELFESLGVSYALNPCWSVGAELLHEVYVPDVETFDGSGVFAGPNVAWRNDRFSVTLTGLWQVTSRDGEPDFQLRTIFAFDF